MCVLVLRWQFQLNARAGSYPIMEASFHPCWLWERESGSLDWEPGAPHSREREARQFKGDLKGRFNQAKPSL